MVFRAGDLFGIRREKGRPLRIMSALRNEAHASRLANDPAALRLYVGTTTGHGYSLWQGNFYPFGLIGKDMQGYIAQQFDAIEFSPSLYHMPSSDLLSAWAAQVPEEFRFALVASSRITHLYRLVGTEEATRYFLRMTKTLGPRRGPLLFQFPLSFTKDEERLVQFLELLPPDVAAAFEFRHPSWHVAAVYRRLERRNCALVVTDGDAGSSPFIATADWGYLRLARTSYTDDELADWLERMREQGWRAAYLFFRHEDDAGVRHTARLRVLAGPEGW